MATHLRVVSSSKGICNSLASASPSHEKDLEKFFKIWVQGILATHLWVSWVAKIVCFEKIGSKLRQFFKNFLVSLASCACLFVFSASPSLKTTHFSIKTSIFIFNLHSKSKKRYGFSLLFYFISSLKHYFSWICCLCWNIEIWLKNMGFCCFLWNWCMGFDENDGIMLVLHVFITCSCIILCFVLWCAYHFVDKMSI